MLTHCVLLSVMVGIIRYLSRDFSTFEIIFFHNVFALLLLLPWVVIKKQSPFHTHKFFLHLSRAGVGYVSFLMYFFVLTKMPLAEVTALSFIGPLVSAIFAMVWLKEGIGPHRIISILISFVGVLIVFRPGIQAVNPYAILILLVVILWAVNSITIRVLGRTEDTITQVFYLTFLMMLFSAPGAYMSWATPAPAHWPWLGALGAIFLVNVIAVFNAYRYSDVSVIVPYDYSKIVFTALIGYFAFDEIPDIWTMLGSAVIVLSTVYFYTARRLRDQKQQYKDQGYGILS